MNNVKLRNSDSLISNNRNEKRNIGADNCPGVFKIVLDSPIVADITISLSSKGTDNRRYRHA